MVEERKIAWCTKLGEPICSRKQQNEVIETANYQKSKQIKGRQESI
jgi:hypothetical protein